MDLPFFTVGHSTHSKEEFVGLLRTTDIGIVADIRKMPRSRANPKFNEGTLAEALALFQIAYEHIAALGGLRGRAKAAPVALNGLWENRSFPNYADYTLTADFRVGLDRLVEVGRARHCAMMCSEAVWRRCHRRIVADYLIARGEAVFHLMGQGRIEPARLTAGAIISKRGDEARVARV
ncbi:DUF488 family protein [Siccirubricoccus sp. G192]|uniref:DUF488 domain-containing protein n=1 Tax=Siccirubricoccus sp. G192 TaxID=2849651 RepID=UPI001C2C0A3E|nr:DUF488 domain-containing protein [Siccirubricoccus sp. G192]MBV1795728.1 DUF488 domain-containing protein [Siccirubricoccus sp. G192]